MEYFVASDASAIVEHTKQVRGEKMSTTMMRRALDYLDLTSIDWLPTSHTRVLNTGRSLIILQTQSPPERRRPVFCALPIVHSCIVHFLHCEMLNF